MELDQLVACKMKKVGTQEITDDETEKMVLKDEPLSFFTLLSYADALDYTLMAFASLGSVIHGLAQLLRYLLLGKAINAFGNNINDDVAMVKALKKVIPFVWYMAFATFPAGVIEVGGWMYASERQVTRLRLAYLKAVLKQEIGAFDTELTNGKIITGISSHMTTYTKKMNSISATKATYLAEATVMVEQTVSQIRTVFAFVGENSAIKSFSECMQRQLIISEGEALIKGVGTGIFQTVTFCSWALIVWIGAIVVVAKRAKGGDVIAAVMSILFGAISITYAAPDMQIFNQARAAGKEVFEVINRKSAISYDTKGKTLEKINGTIEIRDVYFAYPSRQEKIILQGFSLYIPTGKVVALVGSSGCGKSTIISLVPRFYDPEKGLHPPRPRVGKVVESAFPFHAMSSSTWIFHVYTSMLTWNCYKNKVGQRSVQLSGGQKQRIAIARAILKNPPILLLDEATSALDSESEKLVQDALESAMKGRTVILIAHRMSTIVNADMIVVVQNGRVTETGTHSNLLKTSEFYSNLFSIQNISTEGEPSSVNPIKETERTDPVKETERTDQRVSEQLDTPIETNKIFKDAPKKDDQQDESVKKDIFFRIWFGLNNQEFIKIGVGSFAAAFSGISKPVFGFFIITIGVAYFKSGAKEKVGWYSLLFSAIGLLSLFSHTVQHYFYGVIGEKAMTNLRQALYSAVLRNELGWFDKPENNVGSLTSRIITETSTVKTIISDRMSVIVQCISSILIATAVSIKVNWRMGLVAWAVMPCHFIGGLIQAKSAKGFSGDTAAAHSDMVTLASESATNIKTVASFSHEQHILEKAKSSLDPPLKQSRKQSLQYGLIQGVSLCLWNIAHAVALWYSTVLVEKQQASFEDGIRSYQIFSLTVPSITELWTLIPTVISAVNVLTPVFETLDRKTEIEPDEPENPPSDKIIGEIEFRNIDFSYPLRPEVKILDNFSLRVESGSKLDQMGQGSRRF
ncbi:hypothetical protein L1987_23877 [Smallanthus sonchifolius]|uniref:Uncharacterized protein n=1 Tax=Smallanthus sonchifolius TaxID=185202 RepID=A0ACB9II64_9ASTR|nr:hypothetical protein L1987_23877 [Smallanthus sonchifolius]